VRNKSDLPACWSPAALGVSDAPCLDISALHGEGLGALERALVQQALGHAPLEHDEILLTQERHRLSLAAALRNVQAAEQGLRQGVPLEFVAFEVTEALQQVAEVLGESCTGEVLDRIFSSFCIGK
jgi:tRNA modification GTPase